MEIFINKLIEFNNYPKNHRNIFNPWNTTCPICDIQNASEIRCKNLETYLQKHEKAKYILIAESPSTGTRFTGIPMTSEKVIKKYGLVYQCTSKNNRRYQKGENTACKVWKTIGSENKNFVFWNAFAFNINEQKNRWFENPTQEEIQSNFEILKAFIQLFPNAEIIALGRIAEKGLKCLYPEKRIKYIHHPSNDKNNEFLSEMQNYL